jgi:hypothetical protein
VARPIDYQKSYVFAVEMFVRGLNELQDGSSAKDI